MTLRERLSTYLTANRDRHKTKWLKTRDVVLWNEIIKATTFLPSDAMPKQRCWHVLNDVWTIPLCPVDHIPLKWFDDRYLTYSSLSAKNRCPEQLERRTITQRQNKEAKTGLLQSERDKYRKDVWRYTKRNWYHHKTKIEGYELRSRTVHLDHIYSVEDGFKNSVDPSIVGHWANFRMLSREENLEKHMRSDITLEELKSRINQSNRL